MSFAVIASPPRVHTPFVDGFLSRNYPGQEAGKLKVLAKSQPFRRMGTPNEIATLGLYLCSNSLAFVTGVGYTIDGSFFSRR
jgi:2-keto-3-deoxy-L-fuconate dehydrogenase